MTENHVQNGWDHEQINEHEETLKIQKGNATGPA